MFTTQSPMNQLAALALACTCAHAMAQAPTKLPTGDPCTVVPLAEVLKAFPDAKPGVRSRRVEQYGSTQCAYSNAQGQVIFAVEERYGSNTAKEEAQGEATAFLDPLMPAAKRNVRYETLTAIGLGNEAVAFVEKGDAKRGILGDGSLLVLRRGQHTLSLMSPVLPQRERAAALKAYEVLGRVAAKRLD